MNHNFILGMHMEILNVLSDFNTGLTVNSKLVREGKHIRMAEIFIVSPGGDSIGLTEDGVTIINDDFAETFSYDNVIDIQRPDVLVISEPGHKNDNVHVYILGAEGKELILKFFKNHFFRYWSDGILNCKKTNAFKAFNKVFDCKQLWTQS